MEDSSMNPWPHGRLVQANHYQFLPGEILDQRRVESRMLLWVRAGRGALRVNGQRFALEPEDWLLLPWARRTRFHSGNEHPLQVGGVHIIPWHDPEQAVEAGAAHHAEAPLAGVPWRRDKPGLLPLHHHHTEPLPPALRHLLEAMVAKFAADTRGFLSDWSSQMLSVLLTEIRQALRAGASNRRSPEIRQAEKYLQEHFPRRVSQEELCRVLQVSPSTLGRRFQAAHGCSPREYGARLLQSSARHYLTTTSLRISEIAEMIGFDNPFHFSKWFHQREGLSPRDYRTRHAAF